MKLAKPNFDPAKFVKVRCTQRQIPALRDALCKLDQALEVNRRRRWRRFWVLTGGLAIVFLGLQIVDKKSFQLVASLALLGLTFAYVARLLVWLFQKEAVLPRAVCLFAILNPGIFLYLGAGIYWKRSAPLFDLERRPIACALGFIVSTAVVFWFSWVTSWTRLTRLQPQRLEVDYLARIAEPLLGDLAPGVRAALTFNPYRSEWSRASVEAPPARPGYSLRAWADILLSLSIPLDAQRSFRLSVVEYSVEKTKNRKGKYKGTRRVLLYRYDLDVAPPAGSTAPAATDASRDLGPALSQYLQAAMTTWTPEAETSRNYFDKLAPFVAPEAGSLKTTAMARPDRISATLAYKTAGFSPDLEPQHLLPPSLILATARFVGRAAAAC